MCDLNHSVLCSYIKNNRNIGFFAWKYFILSEKDGAIFATVSLSTHLFIAFLVHIKYYQDYNDWSYFDFFILPLISGFDIPRPGSVLPANLLNKTEDILGRTILDRQPPAPGVDKNRNGRRRSRATSPSSSDSAIEDPESRSLAKPVFTAPPPPNEPPPPAAESQRPPTTGFELTCILL